MRWSIKSVLVKCIATLVFFSVAALVHWDRMMTLYSRYPWSFSSQDAMYWAGLIKEVIKRSNFKL